MRWPHFISEKPSDLRVPWNRIVTEHGAMLYRAAYRVLHDCGDAEDVTQEVLLEAYRKHQRSGIVPEAALLRRMATLRAIDQLRRRMHAERLNDVVCGDCTQFPDHVVERGEQADRLRKEIGRLPQREAKCFLLRYVEGMTNQEIAAVLGTNSSAVSTAIYKARTKLAVAERVLLAVESQNRGIAGHGVTRSHFDDCSHSIHQNCSFASM